MKIKFTKMQGAGNDFVMIDAISQAVAMTPDRARKLADRRFGVGCDQVLVVEPPERPENDFKYRIFNADGSEVENCGNGARCFAVFVRARRLTSRTVIRAETAAGVLVLNVGRGERVTVDMGPPILQPVCVPFRDEPFALTYPLVLAQRTLDIGVVSMGNPHAVCVVDDVKAFPVETVGAEVECHRDFPKKVNVGFMQVLSPQAIALRVFERGAGETLACGTGACAAVVSGILRGLLQSPVQVNLPGGQLDIAWSGEGTSVEMTGPAAIVFHGQVRV